MPGLPKIINTLPSGANLMRSAPLPFLAIWSPPHTLPSRSTQKPCGTANLPANRLLKLARGIELLHRRERRIRTFGRPATVEHPDALAVAVIHLDLDGRAEFPTLG